MMTKQRARISVAFLMAVVLHGVAAAEPAPGDDSNPRTWTPLFKGQDLTGWKGLVGDPISRAAMSADELSAAQAKADEAMRAHWRVENGEIVNDGHGPHLCTTEEYGDFELVLDWKISPGADSGIYLRGSPQVQIWDPVNGNEATRVGSGGLYNNQKHRSTPLVRADRPAGEWNSFYIRMIGELVTVRLNGVLVVDNVVMENYWDRSRPMFPTGQIELQTHGGEIRFRNIHLRKISSAEANLFLLQQDSDRFAPLFDGHSLAGWMGSVNGYRAEDGRLICDPASGGNLLTEKVFSDFVLRFEFKVPPGGNNGLAIRAPGTGNPAYDGMEIQILDNTAPEYANLQPYQYHGSIYGVVPAPRGYLRPPGEWNIEEVVCDGFRVIVRLNGTTIVDADLSQIETPMDGNEHPGIRRSSGHLGFMGHGHQVEFRNILIRVHR